MNLAFWVSALQKTHTQMKKIAKTMIVAVLLFASSQLFAQTDVYLNLGGAIPTGDFADGDETGFGLVSGDFTEGGAGMGFTAGLKFKFNTGLKGLGVILSLDGIYNGLNADVRDLFEEAENELEEDYNDFSLKTPKYLNVPLMVGANYTYDINSKIGVYGEAGLGCNFRYITNFGMEVKEAGNKASIVYEYAPTFSFAYQLGAGIEINEKITVGASFYNLGNGKVSGKVKYKESYNGSSTSDSEKFKYKRVTPTMVMLRVGFKF